ncbi:hypothetical protein C9374_014149 [Naegleria lovaniensis]|uniref:Uncharacterized protein n=1 Tax=Naegleria lovaniensis TaxID=51637 RepID=A0AA88KPW8_NAELO|nr:uncharacterized protein C9374_014149 [Naegleria lovaniensis]KAG2389589.1 hypothetical protein C9374_014149 [Naegleria lovaniensis]
MTEFPKQKETLKRFKSLCSPTVIKVNNNKWTYFKCCHSDTLPPLIMLHDLTGSSQDFYNQFSMVFDEGKDLNLISVEIPSHCTTIDEFTMEFDKFLDVLLFLNGTMNSAASPPKPTIANGNLKRSEPLIISKNRNNSKQLVHLFGCGLGAFLIQCYAEQYPDKVASLMIVNGFMNNKIFSDYSPLNDLYILAPKFILSTKVLDLFSPFKDREFANNDEILYAIEYMVDKITDETSQKQLASRLCLISDERMINTKKIIEKIAKPYNTCPCITIVDCMDDVNMIYPTSLRTELHSKYYHPQNNIRLCLMKQGGQFPYLSATDDFNIYLTVHLRGIYQNYSDIDNMETLQVSSPVLSGMNFNENGFSTPFSPEASFESNASKNASSALPILYKHISFTPHTPPDIAEEDITIYSYRSMNNNHDFEGELYSEEPECDDDESRCSSSHELMRFNSHSMSRTSGSVAMRHRSSSASNNTLPTIVGIVHNEEDEDDESSLNTSRQHDILF